VILDAQVAALLVRVTARVSAVLLAASLLAAARRISGALLSPPLAGGARLVDVAVFAAFLVSHTIHFGCVCCWPSPPMARTSGIRGGWIAVLPVGALFYVGGFLLRSGSRD
jgi:hypothetical protein